MLMNLLICSALVDFGRVDEDISVNLDDWSITIMRVMKFQVSAVDFFLEKKSPVLSIPSTPTCSDTER